MAAVRAGAVAERERCDDEVAALDVRDVGADVLHDADELVADWARLERRVAAVLPEVRAHTQASTTRTIASVGSTMAGSGRSPASTCSGSMKGLHAWPSPKRASGDCGRRRQGGIGRAPHQRWARPTAVSAPTGADQPPDREKRPLEHHADIAEFLTTTGIDETLGALTDLVQQGKVRYIGSSSFLAGEIVEAQWAARDGNLQRFRTE